MRVIHNESKTNIIRQHKSLLSRLKVAVENAVYTKMPYPQMPGRVILVTSQADPTSKRFCGCGNCETSTKLIKQGNIEHFVLGSLTRIFNTSNLFTFYSFSEC